jgi:hypothetical protein
VSSEGNKACNSFIDANEICWCRRCQKCQTWKKHNSAIVPVPPSM